MKLNTYLNFGGNCQDSFRFYEQHLGGKITMMVTHAEQPDASKVPANWRDKILHARIELGETELFGADVPPERFQPMRSAYLTLTVSTAQETERVNALLTKAARSSCRSRRPFSPSASRC